MQIHIPNRKLNLLAALILSLASPLAANSAVTNLADAPIGSISSVLPNIMFLLDNSGSMAWRSIVKDGGDAKQDGWEATRQTIKAHSAGWNGIYYDPTITYTPAVKADGTLMPWPQAPYTSLKEDPYGTPNNTNIRSINSSVLGTGYRWCKSNATYTLRKLDEKQKPYTNLLDSQTTNCRDTRSTTYNKPMALFAFYYQYNKPGTPITRALADDSANFTRIDIVPVNPDGSTSPMPTYTALNPDGTPSGITRTYDEEMKNYATWYMYYSTRMKMMKGTIGKAFQKVVPVAGASPTVRVGFTNLNKSIGTGVGVRINDFQDTSLTGQVGAWYNNLYTQETPNGTPLRSNFNNVGKLFKNGSPYDPIQYSCQRNITIMSTDGYWNSDPDSIGIGEQDNVDAGWSKRSDGVYAPTISGLDTLSDIALYYYKNDLRPSLTNNVPAIGTDTATHQHMSTYTIGLTSGTLNYSKTYETDTSGDFYNIKTSTAYNWPVPVADTKTALDDLWHAAVSGRGYGVVATNQNDVQEGLDRILNRASAGLASGSGIGVASPILSDDNKLIYRTQFDNGTWGGELAAFEVDPITGLPVSATPIWSASSKLDALASGTGWDVSRKIITRNASIGVPFRWDNLTSTQQSNLQSATPANNAAQAQSLLNFLRGDISNEGTLFRDRKGFNSTGNGVLGDIVASEALVISAPFRLYQELDDKGYTTFKTDKANRVPMVYVGANDGMVHAFKAGKDADSGEEKWAYVPSLVLRSAADNGLGVLGRIENGVPAFQHRFFVNGQAYPNDIDFANTGTHYDTINPASHTPNWGTILVGGLGKGGRGYYALDVTNGYDSGNETAIASKSLWEFTDADMGYTYGRPTVIKTRKHGWVAMFTSGLNNPSGRGHIYIVNAKTGGLIAKLDTDTEGTPTTPSNLMELSVFESDNTKPYADQVYAGDMLGNVWRFDLRDTSPSFADVWQNSKTLISKLRDAATGANVQPITTRPQIQIDSYSKNRWVFVGTGQYLHDDDRDATKTMWSRIQTMYAFRDGDTGTPATFATPVSRSTPGFTNISNSNTAGATESAVGWYMDMAAASGSNAAERIVVNPVAALDAVAWATTIPTSDVCSSGASGNLYVRQYATAKTLLKDTLDQPKAYESSVDGFVGLRLVKNKYGKVKIVATTPKGNIEIYLPNLTGSSLKQPRVSWRELIEN